MNFTYLEKDRIKKKKKKKIVENKIYYPLYKARNNVFLFSTSSLFLDFLYLIEIKLCV